MKKFVLALLVFALASLAWAKDKDDNGPSDLESATATVQHMTATAGDKGVPLEVMEGAKCVAVIPKLIKGAFIVGGEHGDGVATCRTANGWSAPAPFTVSGISWGPQIGGKSTDLMMFFMNDQGAKDLMAGHFKVGADASAVAGPVGRSGSAEGGWKAAILTYSSAKGAFIGASLNGAELHQNDKATENWYGKIIPFQEILTGNAPMPNAQARTFVNAVAQAKEAANARK